ncbi:MAG: strictosidine synthase family protein [Gammaproteobacteria bacterium]|nr:strictosidine synthase family protein [Gammaproteobacteria bacterium]
MLRIAGTVIGVLIVCCATVMAVLYNRSELEPEVWVPAPLPKLNGVYTPTGLLNDASFVPFEGRLGPEDIARGPDGKFYTGLEDGSVVRFGASADSVVEPVINTGGRVLGLQFDRNGNLVMADAVHGLLQLSPEGTLSTLTDHVDGQKLRYVDDLDIAGDGTIWFSDASMRFGYKDTAMDFIEASATGRLLSFTPATGETRVHLRDLFFANGVAVGPQDRFVLVSETGTGRIHRLWLRGPQSGQSDLFHAGLPGNPDNLSFNGSDMFWVALPALRDRDVESIAGNLFLRRLLGGLPIEHVPIREPVGFVIGLDPDGQVVHCLLSRDDTFHTITSVNQWGKNLYLGSLAMSHMAIVAAPDLQR